MEATMMEETKTVTLDDILSSARKLSAYDKLMLIRILAQELASDELAYFSPALDEPFVEATAQVVFPQRDC